MNKNGLNNKIDDLSSKAQCYMDNSEKKATEMINNVHDKSIDMIKETQEMAHDIVDKGKNMIDNNMDKMNDMINNIDQKMDNTMDKAMDSINNKHMNSTENMNHNFNQYNNNNKENNNMKNNINSKDNNNHNNAMDYIKEYAHQHPIITTTAVSATVLAGASLISPNTRKMTKPIAKYAFKQQGKLALGVGMLAMATYLTNKDNSMDNNMHPHMNNKGNTTNMNSYE